MGCGVWGVGWWGVGCGVWGVGCGVWVSGVRGLRFRVPVLILLSPTTWRRGGRESSPSALLASPLGRPLSYERGTPVCWGQLPGNWGCVTRLLAPYSASPLRGGCGGLDGQVQRGSLIFNSRSVTEAPPPPALRLKPISGSRICPQVQWGSLIVNSRSVAEKLLLWQAALEATQGQTDGSFSQLPYKCHQNRVASVGD